LPAIPDYAVDMHTQRGKHMGRGKKHFLLEGALVSPELVGREHKYCEYLIELLSRE
jgi:hypothetical protein